ncbi:MAG TPA: hypothetical protein VGQ42_06265 [Candidatus Dormibacteraeota bacterium]|nr:hypothetical protein [Candidatus Dormibacteraeota bacterium]
MRIAAGGALLVGVLIVVVAVMAGGDSGPTPVGSNGESTKTVKDILNDSALAFSRAQSFHLTGTAASGTEKDAFDLHIGVGGARGTLTANGATAEMISIGDDAWFRGREFFSTFSGPDAGAAIGDSWVHLKTDDPKYAQYFRLLTLAGLQQAISQIAMEASVFKAHATSVDGALVMPLRAADGEIDVALDGSPYPRRLLFNGQDGKGELRFLEFDAPMPAPTTPGDVFGVPKPPTL